MKNKTYLPNWPTQWMIASAILVFGFTTPTIAQTDSSAAATNSEATTIPRTRAFELLKRFEPNFTSNTGTRQVPSQPTDKQPTTTVKSTSVSQKRIEAIHSQISLIKELMEKNEQAKIEENQPSSQLSPTQQDTPNKLQPPSIETGAIQEDSDLPVSNQDPEIAIPPQVSGTPVVAHPINPFKLANSLFLTGNIEASRKSYEAGLAGAKPEEELWLKCFIGCCYRLEGNFDGAESMFREVTNDQSSAFPVDYARWCLKYLQQRRNSLSQFTEIEADIERILIELEDKNGK